MKIIAIDIAKWFQLFIDRIDKYKLHLQAAKKLSNYDPRRLFWKKMSMCIFKLFTRVTRLDAIQNISVLG